MEAHMKFKVSYTRCNKCKVNGNNIKGDADKIADSPKISEALWYITLFLIFLHGKFILM